MTNELKKWLTTINQKILNLETEAKYILTQADYKEPYNNIMLEKAKILATLPMEYNRFIKQHPNLADSVVEEKIQSFASGANNALQLNSIFYMSALLYPDNHKPGEPNNLEILISNI